MNQPHVAILISAYNAEPFIRDAVRSALEQTHRNVSVWVLDDGSTDRTWEVLKSIDDPRLHLLQTANRGKSAAMNDLLEACGAPYFAMQDADDFSFPERAAIIARHLENEPDLALVMTGYEAVVEDRAGYRVHRTLSRSASRAEIMQYRLPSHDPTMAGRVDIARHVGFDTDLRIAQGVDFIWRLGERHPIKVIPDVLYRYRIHATSSTRRHPTTVNSSIARVVAAAISRRTGRLVTPEQTARDLDIHRDRANNLHAIYMLAVRSALEAGDRREALRVGFDSLKDVRLGMNYLKPLVLAIGGRPFDRLIARVRPPQPSVVPSGPDPEP